MARRPDLGRAPAEPELAGLDDLARRQTVAAVYAIHNAPAWQAMRDYFGLTAEEAGRAAAWAIGALLNELKQTPRKNAQATQVR